MPKLKPSSRSIAAKKAWKTRRANALTIASPRRSAPKKSSRTKAPRMTTTGKLRKTPEERSEIARQAWVTRRRNIRMAARKLKKAVRKA